jgi:hypothetical protein
MRTVDGTFVYHFLFGLKAISLFPAHPCFDHLTYPDLSFLIHVHNGNHSFQGMITPQKFLQSLNRWPSDRYPRLGA